MRMSDRRIMVYGMTGKINKDVTRTVKLMESSNTRSMTKASWVSTWKII